VIHAKLLAKFKQKPFTYVWLLHMEREE